MSRNKIAMLGGILLCLSIFAGCNNSVGSPAENPTDNPVENPDENEFVVTYEFGEYGVETQTRESTVSVKVKEGECASCPTTHIKADYQGQVKVISWKNKDTNQTFDFETKIQSDITLVATYKAVEVSNLSAKQISDSEILVTWSNVPNSRYETSWTSDGSTYTTNADETNAYFEIENYTVGKTYTISVKRFSTIDDDELINEGNEKTIEITAATYSNHTEFLMLMYMDGDNNLNDPIYLDLNEAEYGLSELPEGSSVRVVALWDGWDFETNNDDDDYSAFDYSTYYNINTASTKLLELGADARVLYTPNGGFYFDACQLSSSTIDLTCTADWIEDNEVDMASEETLENFLRWAKNRYSYDHIILQFSNHGGGPRAAGERNKRRSMCWDESSGGDSFLKTKDVSTALRNTGFIYENKIDLIMEDVCLGGSLEEAYQLHGFANYYIGSPNNVPGSGYDYISFVSSLKPDATIEQIGSNLVKTYRADYEWTETDWAKFLKDNPDFVNYTDFYKSVLNPNANTLSFIDLTKILDVKEQVDTLAKIILEDYDVEVVDGESIYNYRTEERIKADANGTLYFLNDDGKYYDYKGKLCPSNTTLTPVTRKFALKWWTAYYGDPIYYGGSFGCLKDLGTMCEYMRSYYSGKYFWPELTVQTNYVTSALADAIIASWRDGYNQPTYYKMPDEPTENLLGTEDLGLGLTINCSCWSEEKDSNGKKVVRPRMLDWYTEDLDFGKDCSYWSKLISDWWGIPE